MLPWRSSLWPLLAMLAILAIAAAIAANYTFAQRDLRHRAEALTGGNAPRGQALFIQKGCGGCHSVTGVAQADGLVGPPLGNVGERAVIAGKLANTPDNLEHWISAPQSVVPGNAMPNLPMSGQDSRDIAAFLYSRG